jgi:Spy/CpxP family protein refolding chaperone
MSKGQNPMPSCRYVARMHAHARRPCPEDSGTTSGFILLSLDHFLKDFSNTIKEENKMRLKKGLIIALAQIIIIVGAFTVNAMAFGQASGHMGSGLFGLKTLLELNLTEDQRAKILSIIGKYETDRDLNRNSLRDARKGLRTALQASEFNEATIRAAYQQISKLREDQLVTRLKMMGEIKSVLSPEQLDLLKARKAQRMDKFKSGKTP